jgi:RNA polymerase-binding transcription factor DksA
MSAADDGTRHAGPGLIASESHLPAKVLATLEWIGGGRLGTHERRGRKIARARLAALPYARECIRRARAARPVAG